MPNSYVLYRLAKHDLREIVDYLTAQNPAAAQRFLIALRDDFRLLSEYPGIGGKRFMDHPRLAGMRSWPVRKFRNYLIFYMPHPSGIAIARILHSARDIDRLLREI